MCAINKLTPALWWLLHNLGITFHLHAYLTLYVVKQK